MEKDQLISFITAKLAKEKGFNLKTTYRFIYDATKGISGNGDSNLNWNNWHETETIKYASQPTQTMLNAWLRSKGIHIELIIDGWVNDEAIEEPCYRGFIWQVGKPKPHHNDDIGCAKYEIILEVALEEALKLL